MSKYICEFILIKRADAATSYLIHLGPHTGTNSPHPGRMVFFRSLHPKLKDGTEKAGPLLDFGIISRTCHTGINSTQSGRENFQFHQNREWRASVRNLCPPQAMPLFQDGKAGPVYDAGPNGWARCAAMHSTSGLIIFLIKETE